ncbi:hypothetical protein KEJ19_01110 [Candidatus Bathyarchaeota archaeon]|nr:hypothetical protein [Candidatus Bathyarchaeota archaeon]
MSSQDRHQRQMEASKPRTYLAFGIVLGLEDGDGNDDGDGDGIEEEEEDEDEDEDEDERVHPCILIPSSAFRSKSLFIFLEANAIKSFDLGKPYVAASPAQRSPGEEGLGSPVEEAGSSKLMDAKVEFLESHGMNIRKPIVFPQGKP